MLETTSVRLLLCTACTPSAVAVIRSAKHALERAPGLRMPRACRSWQHCQPAHRPWNSSLRPHAPADTDAALAKMKLNWRTALVIAELELEIEALAQGRTHRQQLKVGDCVDVCACIWWWRTPGSVFQPQSLLGSPLVSAAFHACLRTYLLPAR